MNKILFFDIDGTLLSDKTYKIPKSTIKAINNAKEKGYQCFLCTGRSFKMTKEVSECNINNAIITNGMGIIIDGKPLILNSIDKDVTSKTIDLIEKYNGGYQIIDWKYGYQNPYNYNNSKKAFLSRFPDVDPQYFFDLKGMKSIDEYKGDEILKIDVTLNSEEDCITFEKELDESLEITWAGGYTNNTNYAGEIVVKGYSKGTGIKEVCEYYNVSLKDTFGFGDSTNDIEMLKVVGKSIVMGNAPLKVKEYATYVTSDIDDDGLAKAMKHFNLT